MKKMMTLMLGLALVLGTSAFAQETKDTTKKEGKTKKSKKTAKKDDAAGSSTAPKK